MLVGAVVSIVGEGIPLLQVQSVVVEALWLGYFLWTYSCQERKMCMEWLRYLCLVEVLFVCLCCEVCFCDWY